MKTVEQAIFEQYGVKLGPSAADVQLRAFVIDQFRNGYLIKLPAGYACFGSVIDGERFVWNDGKFRPVGIGDQKDSREIQFEWMIWRIAREMVERGEILAVDDQERLALAVQRLESWL